MKTLTWTARGRRTGLPRAAADPPSGLYRAAGSLGLGLLGLFGALRDAPARAMPVGERPAGVQTAASRLYVPNQLGASISVLDGTGTVLATVDLREFGFSPHAMPHQVAARPDGSAWYVTLAGDGWVLQFDQENRLVARARFEAPGMLVLDPGRDRLYVSRALAAVSPPSSLGAFRASDLTLLEEPEVFLPRPHGLAVDTTSGRVYVASIAGGQIAAYDPERGRASLRRVPEAAHGFVGLAVSPDGRRLAATTQLEGRLLVFDGSRPEDLPLVASIAVEPGPYDVAFSPDGRSVWFPNQLADAVTRVDADSWTVAATIRHAAFVEPHGVVWAPDGSTVYVTSHGRPLPVEGVARPGANAGSGAPPPVDLASPRENGTVAVIDAATGDVLAVAEVGPYAAAPGLAAVAPVDRRAARDPEPDA